MEIEIEALKAKMQNLDEFKCVLSQEEDKENIKTYKIQIKKQLDKFQVEVSQGKLGNQPKEQTFQFDNQDDAINKFQRLFENKTKNNWENRKEFRHIGGEYKLVSFGKEDPDYKIQEVEHNRIKQRNLVLEKRIQTNQTNLDSYVKDLLSSLFQAIFKHEEGNLLNKNYQAINHLSLQQLSTGYNVLKSIAPNLDKNIKTNFSLTRQFYKNVPLARKEDKIDSYLSLKDKLQILDQFSNIEYGHQILDKIYKKQEQEQNPLDQYLSQFHIQIQRVDNQDVQYKLLKQAFQTASSQNHLDKFSFKIMDIFSIEKPQETMKYYPFQQQFSSSRKYLYYGCKSSNVLATLTKGLTIPEFDAPHQGYPFGKGIQLTDISSKAIQNCKCSQRNNVGYVFVCEAALGTMFEVKKQKPYFRPPVGFNSIKGIGKLIPDPNFVDIDKQGVFIEQGALVENQEQTELNYNEYILYEESQIRLRYLIKVNLEFKSF